MPRTTDYLKLTPAILSFIHFRRFGYPRRLPISLTVSITNVCNSRCKTCNIWKLYQEENELSKGKELELHEFEKIFKKIGKTVFWYTLSGGEPLVRNDVVDIVEAMRKYNDPKILIIPTNGILTDRILKRSEKILDIMNDTTVIVNLSLDGLKERHDEIRGVAGNFDKAMETYEGLKGMKERHPNLELGVHSVISRFNVNEIPKLYPWIKENLAPDSYISEIAENREELFNVEDDIAPGVEEYSKVINGLREEQIKEFKKLRGVPKIIQAFRIEYYDLVVRQLREKREILPCYAGVASGQISAYGDVWPCCIHGYKYSMGNLRENDYNLKRIWYSEKAKDIRRMIRNSHCYCPMANVHYTNTICSPRTLFRILLGGVL